MRLPGARGRRFGRAAGAAVLLLWAAAAHAWSFAACGDSRNDEKGIFPRILEAVASSDMEFLIHLGDLEHPGGEASWESFRRKTAGFRKPLRLVIGNHELVGATREQFADFFGLPGPNYSFTHRELHVAVLDNAGGNLSAETLQWLDADLSAHARGRNGVRHLAVAMHAPPRTETTIPHGMGRGYAEESAALLAILAKHGVALVLAGHEHLHAVEEWEGIKVIVTGGAGAPLYPFHRHGFYRIDVAGGELRETFVPAADGRPSPPVR